MPATIIEAQLAVDPALTMSAGYRFDASDRRYLDDQVRGCERLLVDALVSGQVGSWYIIDSGSASLVTGDTVCLAASVLAGVAHRMVTKAVAAALANAGRALGMVVSGGGGPGALVRVAVLGVVPTSVSGLAASGNLLVRVNTTTARAERVAAYSAADYPLGTADSQGSLSLSCATAAASATVAAPLTLTGASDVTELTLKEFAGQTSDPLQIVTSASVLIWRVGPDGSSNAWGETVATPRITQLTRTTDAATADLTIRAQAPYASATGTNRNPGNVVLDVQSPAAGGAAGKLSVQVSGSEMLSSTLPATNNDTTLTIARKSGGVVATGLVTFFDPGNAGANFTAGQKVLVVA